MVLSNWALGTVLMLAPLQLIVDTGAVVAWLTTGWRSGAPDDLRLVLIATTGLLSAIGVAQAIRVPAVRDIEVDLRGLPQPFEGYVLLQLTDLHISRLFPAKWVRAVVARSRLLGADTILITGDLIDGMLAMRQADVAPLRDLHAPDGVFVVPGNHEYFFDCSTWMRHFAKMGMHPLCNVHARLVRDGHSLVLAGVTDPASRLANLPGPDLPAALTGVRDNDVVVLLDHQPREVRKAAAAGVALQLSGHTHGGLIRGLDRLFARPNGGFISGRYAVGATVLYVSNGTGVWPGFALRLGRPSEMTRITLRRLRDGPDGAEVPARDARPLAINPKHVA